MKRLFGVLGGLAVVSALLMLQSAQAKPAPCVQLVAQVTFTPSNVATLDGLSVLRSPTSGKFERDGLQFDIETATLVAVEHMPLPPCFAPAERATLTAFSPFANQADAGMSVFEVRP